MAKRQASTAGGRISRLAKLRDGVSRPFLLGLRLSWPSFSASLLECLLGRRMSLIQSLLALAFGAGANQLGFHGLLGGFGRGDLRIGLVDAGKCLGYARVLQLALPAVVLNCGAGSRNCGSGLVNLSSVVI